MPRLGLLAYPHSFKTASPFDFKHTLLFPPLALPAGGEVSCLPDSDRIAILITGAWEVPEVIQIEIDSASHPNLIGWEVGAVQAIRDRRKG